MRCYKTQDLLWRDIWERFCLLLKYDINGQITILRQPMGLRYKEDKEYLYSLHDVLLPTVTLIYLLWGLDLVCSGFFATSLLTRTQEVSLYLLSFVSTQINCSLVVLVVLFLSCVEGSPSKVNVMLSLSLWDFHATWRETEGKEEKGKREC